MRASILGLILLPALSCIAAPPAYTSVSVGQNGQLLIRTTSGQEIHPQKEPDQIGFGSPLISPDHQTVGWLALYPFPVPGGRGDSTHPIAGKLVIYRNGRMLHTFDSDQTFWDWSFRGNRNRVAYSRGPTHGGAMECVLRDVDSGRIVERWIVGNGVAPAWARDLRR